MSVVRMLGRHLQCTRRHVATTRPLDAHADMLYTAPSHTGGDQCTLNMEPVRLACIRVVHAMKAHSETKSCLHGAQASKLPLQICISQDPKIKILSSMLPQDDKSFKCCQQWTEQPTDDTQCSQAAVACKTAGPAYISCYI